MTIAEHDRKSQKRHEEAMEEIRSLLELMNRFVGKLESLEKRVKELERMAA